MQGANASLAHKTRLGWIFLADVIYSWQLIIMGKYFGMFHLISDA